MCLSGTLPTASEIRIFWYRIQPRDETLHGVWGKTMSHSCEAMDLPRRRDRLSKLSDCPSTCPGMPVSNWQPCRWASINPYPMAKLPSGQQVTSRTPPKHGALGNIGHEEQVASTWLGNARIRNRSPEASPGSNRQSHRRRNSPFNQP